MRVIMSREYVRSKHSLKMGLAIKRLKELGIEFDKVSEYQIKVGEWNFYPSKGTIFRDGDPRKLRDHGLEAFTRIIRPDTANLRALPGLQAIELGDMPQG
jgi:hypothetical protein